MNPVLKTDDYSIFRKNRFNRGLDERNLQKICESILTRNLLEFRPILVNAEMEVIDGQHRLEAARKLRIPIYYTIDAHSVEEDIVLLNNNQKNWSSHDYLMFYCEKGKEEYLKFNDLLNAHGMATKDILGLLPNTGLGYKSLWEAFRRGVFKMPPEQTISELKMIIRYLNEITEHIVTVLPRHKKMALSGRYKRTLMRFLNREDVEVSLFMKKIQDRSSMIHNCFSEGEYMIMWKEIYNWNNRNPIN